MRKLHIFFGLFAFFGILLTSCGTGKHTSGTEEPVYSYEREEELTFWVSPETTTAMGMWEQEITCFQISEEKKAENITKWESLCDQIQGFKHDGKHLFRIRVKRKWLKNHEMLADRAPYDLSLDEILEKVETDTPQDDGDYVICTEVFMTIPIEVVDQNGNNVQLDEFYTLDVETNEKIMPQELYSPGSYPVLDDSHQPKLKGKERSFEFIGKVEGEIVVRAPFVIGADACHIYKVSGDLKVQIKP